MISDFKKPLAHCRIPILSSSLKKKPKGASAKKKPKGATKRKGKKR
jgi:hypothetical protein